MSQNSLIKASENKKSHLAPIALFAYKRLDALKKSIDALKVNYLAPETDLFIFSDGPKTTEDETIVTELRHYLRSVTGFNSIKIIETQNNKGLANSIIDGVTEIINIYSNVIVVEDDLIVSENFLSFMNLSLDYYQNNQNVFSVSGFMFDVVLPKDYSYDSFFTMRHCSWGWGMWKDRWNVIDWQVKDYDLFIKSRPQQRSFNSIGSDLSSLLIKQMNNKIDSWAIRCVYHQFKNKLYTVYPVSSKVINLGFNADATHTTQKVNRYSATLDDGKKRSFVFPEKVDINEVLNRQFKRKYSLISRVFYFLLNKFF